MDKMVSIFGFVHSGHFDHLARNGLSKWFLQMSIYRLKQVSRSWNIRFDQNIKYYGYDQIVD